MSVRRFWLGLKVLLEERNNMEFEAASVQLLDEMVDAHKASIAAVKSAGKAASDAAKEWMSNKGALKKAQELEARTAIKEEAGSVVLNFRVLCKRACEHMQQSTSLSLTELRDFVSKLCVVCHRPRE